jgi:hypothetical protein
MRVSVVASCLAILIATPAFATGGTGIGKGSTMGMGSEAPAAAHTGTVTKIDATAMSFSCHWKSQDHTILTNSSTMFMAGTQSAKFADIKVGGKVKVQSHKTEQGDMADSVTILN